MIKIILFILTLSVVSLAWPEYFGFTCVTKRSLAGQYAVTSCKIGGDAQKIYDALPEDDDEFDPDIEKPIQVGVPAGGVFHSTKPDARDVLSGFVE